MLSQVVELPEASETMASLIMGVWWEAEISVERKNMAGGKKVVV